MMYTKWPWWILTGWHANLSTSLQQATVHTIIQPHQICYLHTVAIRNSPARVSNFHWVSNGILWTDKWRWAGRRTKEAE